jgi:RNA polymerase sigma factor (sigma-70 family)
MKLKRSGLLAKFASDAAEHYSADLHRFLARRMHRPQDIEDLVQEVYIRLLRVEDDTFIRNPRNYILTTAAHVVSDFIAKEQRTRKFVVVDSEMVETVTENPSELPSDQIASRLSTQKQLNAALEKLPPLHQAVLLMFYREGYKYEEIAGRLKVSVDQVERYLAHAKRAIMAIDWGWD